MSTRGIPSDARRQVFLDSLMSGTAAQLALSPGITVRGQNAATRPGLALQIVREALQPGQLQRALERRFEQALAFDGCYIYADAKDALVIWHALPATESLLYRALSRMLTLASLQALDTGSSG